MRQHKKTLFSLLGSLLYSTSQMLMAGSMGATCAVGEVSTPCDARGWGFGAQALYLSADFASLNFIGSTTDMEIGANEEHFLDKQFDDGFGFKLETFYNFRSGRDLNLNWYHYEHTTYQSLPNFVNVYDSAFTGSVLLRLKPQWNAVNLELGQRIDLNTLGNIRFHGGLQYANMQLSNVTTGTGTQQGVTKNRVNDSSFQGVGLRAGTDLTYAFSHGVELYSNVGGALLSGHHSFNRQANFYAGRGTILSGNYGTARATVTELEGKLGAKYSRSLAQGVLRLDAGWMWVNYYNAIEVADSFHNGRTKESNFAIQGSFVGLTWTGHLA